MSVTNNKRANDFHQHHQSTPRSYIILDNQSTVDVFCNPVFLRNIRTFGRTLHLSCNAGTVTVNQVGNLHGYGKLWYHPKGIANILRLCNVTDIDKYLVRYDSQDSKKLIVPRTKDGKETRFYKAPRGLQWLDTKYTKTGEDGEVLINTVDDNKCSFTCHSY